VVGSSISPGMSRTHCRSMILETENDVTVECCSVKKERRHSSLISLYKNGKYCELYQSQNTMFAGAVMIFSMVWPDARIPIFRVTKKAIVMYIVKYGRFLNTATFWYNVSSLYFSDRKKRYGMQ
jgi:hypothetical protein